MPLIDISIINSNIRVDIGRDTVVGKREKDSSNWKQSIQYQYLVQSEVELWQYQQLSQAKDILPCYWWSNWINISIDIMTSKKSVHLQPWYYCVESTIGPVLSYLGCPLLSINSFVMHLLLFPCCAIGAFKKIHTRLDSPVVVSNQLLMSFHLFHDSFHIHPSHLRIYAASLAA